MANLGHFENSGTSLPSYVVGRRRVALSKADAGLLSFRFKTLVDPALVAPGEVQTQLPCGLRIASGLDGPYRPRCSWRFRIVFSDAKGAIATASGIQSDEALAFAEAAASVERGFPPLRLTPFEAGVAAGCYGAAALSMDGTSIALDWRNEKRFLEKLADIRRLRPAL